MKPGINMTEQPAINMTEEPTETVPNVTEEPEPAINPTEEPTLSSWSMHRNKFPWVWSTMIAAGSETIVTVAL